MESTPSPRLPASATVAALVVATVASSVVLSRRHDPWSDIVQQADMVAATLSSDAMATQRARGETYTRLIAALSTRDAPLGALVRAVILTHVRRQAVGTQQASRNIHVLLSRLPSAPTRLSAPVRAATLRWVSALYATPEIPITMDRAPDLVRDVDATPLGWFRPLARERLAERVGDASGAQRWRAVSHDASNRRAGRLTGVASVVVLLCVIGVVTWIMFLVMRAKARRAGVTPEPLVGARGGEWLLWGLAGFLASSLALHWLAGWGVHHGLGATRGPVALSLALQLTASVAGLMVLRRAMIAGGLRPIDIGIGSSSVATDIRWGLAGYSAMVPLLLPAVCLVQRLLPQLPDHAHPAVGIAGGNAPAAARVMLFVAAVVVAPIVEEVFFRGVLLNALWARTGRRGVAIAGSAFVFAIIHPQFYLGWIGVFVIGTVLGIVFVERRSLLPCIVLHAVNNCFALAASRALGD